MGLRAGNHTTGLFPGEQDHDFVCWCRNFLLEQIRLMQPQLILSLGAYVPRFLAPLSPELRIVWSDVTQLTTLDERETALVYPSIFAGLQRPAAVVALTYPSYRPVNIKHRRYGNLEGNTAEQALVRDALTRIGHR